jgi:hypothetical protein
MRSALALLAVVVAGSSVSGVGRVPEATRAVKVCAAAGSYWPTMTLAFSGTAAWVACKEQSRVIRVDTRTGKVARSVRLGLPVIAVASGFGSVWTLDSAGTLDRLAPATGKVVARISLPVSAAYNIWLGGGSVWVADDQGAQVVRVSPATNKVVARLPTGDGPADMAFAGNEAWVVNHRDKVLTHVDLRSNRSSKLAVLAGEAPERMVWLGGSLWITGRGTDLLKVDPRDGALQRTVEIGASGIDVAASGGALWIPTRSEAVDPSGFPTMDAVKRVSAATGKVAVVARPTARVDVHGIATSNGAVWIADNTNGVLYRLPSS